MKYLKYLQTTNDFESFKNSEDYILPNVSYIVETKGVKYDSKKSFKLRAKYNATPDNLVAFTGATNLKSLKVNGNSIKIEPIKNEIITFDVLGENISLNMETGAASFPESYLIKSPVSSWSFKAKDPNYVINENTHVCMLGMINGMTLAQPIPFEEIGHSLTTNADGSISFVAEFLAEMNMQIQNDLPIGFTFVDIDKDNNTFIFIDTEHQTNVTTGGLSTYSFDSEGLYDVEIELSDPVMNMVFTETPLISIEIGDGITSIGEGALSDCSGLTSIVIPDSVTSIGIETFYGCVNLTSVTIGSGVNTIGVAAFGGCSGLTSINIPDSVTSIGDGAFYYCSGLTEVTIGTGVTEISTNAFYGCSSLTSINIPDSVTSIGTNAFYGCSSLTSIVIPNSVTTIGDYAFYDCSGLTSVNIGSGVTEIGKYAFYDCSSLTSITCLAPTAPTIDSYTFHGVKNDGILKVPIESESNYETWMSTDEYYLGYYGWNMEYFIPENAKIFEITYDVEENARQTEELFNLIYTNLGEENIKNNVYANTSVSVKEATGYDYISYSYEYTENSIFFFEIIEIDAYDDMISINFGHNVYSYHFSDNSYETKEMPV